MAAITLVVLGFIIIIPTAIFEGIMAANRRAKEEREWRKLKKIYY